MLTQKIGFLRVIRYTMSLCRVRSEAESNKALAHVSRRVVFGKWAKSLAQYCHSGVVAIRVVRSKQNTTSIQRLVYFW